MIVRSLALTTELALAATRGRITDRGDYIVVETPDDPGYYYGNLLVLPAAPQVGEVGYWTRRFADELGKNPAIRHVTLSWDGVSGDAGAVDELTANGFTLESNVALVATEVTARPPSDPRIVLRALEPAEVEALADLLWATGDRHDETYRNFLDRRSRWHRSLVERGMARFWGAFDGTAIVGSLGLVTFGDLARYQDVQTMATHRTRGIASALLATAAREAFATGTVERVVIVANAGSEGERVYTRAGFTILERTASACNYPSVT